MRGTFFNQVWRGLVPVLGSILLAAAATGCGGNDGAKPPDASAGAANEQELPIMKNLEKAKGEPAKRK